MEHFAIILVTTFSTLPDYYVTVGKYRKNSICLWPIISEITTAIDCELQLHISMFQQLNIL